MAAKPVPEVLPTNEAREQLSKALARFRTRGARAEPIIFGAHRRPEAAVVPFALMEQLLPLLDDLWIAAEAGERLEGDNGERLTLEELVSNLGLNETDKT